MTLKNFYLRDDFLLLLLDLLGRRDLDLEFISQGKAKSLQMKSVINYIYFNCCKDF